MSEFEPALKKTLLFEGGYVADPDDDGGETNYGITKEVALENGFTGDLAEIPMTVVVSIYQKKYWDPLKAGLLIPQALAESVFDCGVNCGVRMASRLLQRAVGAVEDGIIGPVTVNTANLDAAALQKFSDVRRAYYQSLVDKNPKLAKFLKGWLNRCKA